MTSEEPIELSRGQRVRHANKLDVARITSDWLKSFRRTGSFCRDVPNTYYYHYQKLILTELLTRAMVLVVCATGDDNDIHGWICCEKMGDALLVHYLYVVGAHRRKGLATRLLKLVEDAEQPHLVVRTHETTNSFNYFRAHPELATDHLYNPYLLFATLPLDWDKVGD